MVRVCVCAGVYVRMRVCVCGGGGRRTKQHTWCGRFAGRDCGLVRRRNRSVPEADDAVDSLWLEFALVLHVDRSDRGGHVQRPVLERDRVLERRPGWAV